MTAALPTCPGCAGAGVVPATGEDSIGRRAVVVAPCPDCCPAAAASRPPKEALTPEMQALLCLAEAGHLSYGELAREPDDYAADLGFPWPLARPKEELLARLPRPWIRVRTTRSSKMPYRSKTGVRDIPQGSPPCEARIYSLTAAGRAAVDAWDGWSVPPEAG